jgi:hypothetical protein
MMDGCHSNDTLPNAQAPALRGTSDAPQPRERRERLPWRSQGRRSPPKAVEISNRNRVTVGNEAIYEDLAVGKVTPELREAFIAICRRHIEGNYADAVILGCTEVPLVLAGDDLPVPLVDTARCHADAIFEQARN